MEDLLINLLSNLLCLLAALIAAFLVAFLKQKVGTERLRQIDAELMTKQELAMLAVRFAEQAYRDFRGEEKYQKAAEWLATRAGQLGLAITADEMKGLIEAALRTLKDDFGEEWANKVKQE